MIPTWIALALVAAVFAVLGEYSGKWWSGMWWFLCGEYAAFAFSTWVEGRE